MGMEFYQMLFEKYPFVLPIFGRADMDYLSLHLFQAVEFLVRCLRTGSSNTMLQELRFLGQVHSFADVPTCAYPAISNTIGIPNSTVMLAIVEREGGSTLLDQLGDNAPNGKRFTLQGCGFFHVVNGKIKFQRGYIDKQTWFDC
jgi:hypothetical protein